MTDSADCATCVLLKFVMSFPRQWCFGMPAEQEEEDEEKGWDDMSWKERFDLVIKRYLKQRERHVQPGSTADESEPTPTLVGSQIVLKSKHLARQTDEVSQSIEYEEPSAIGSSANASVDWNEQRFLELNEYRNRVGHSMVPSDFPENPQLGQWVKTLRDNARKGGRLSVAQAAKLDAIGFFAPHQASSYSNASWEERYQQLLEYKAEHGHCNVPRNYPSLGNWVWQMRYKHKNKTLSTIKVARLEEAGFQWTQDLAEAGARDMLASHAGSRRKSWSDLSWRDRLQLYARYNADLQGEESSGDSMDSICLQLEEWAEEQRQAYKDKKLSGHETAQLYAYGVLEVLDQWQERYEELAAYKERHGGTNVPQGTNKRLGKWVTYQREMYRKKTLSKEKIAKLEALGLKWMPKQRLRWNERYRELLLYRDEFGNVDVPSSLMADPWIMEKWGGLVDWVARIRQIWKTDGPLAASLITKLNGIGFQWQDPSEGRTTEAQPGPAPTSTSLTAAFAAQYYGTLGVDSIAPAQKRKVDSSVEKTEDEDSSPASKRTHLSLGKKSDGYVDR